MIKRTLIIFLFIVIGIVLTVLTRKGEIVKYSIDTSEITKMSGVVEDVDKSVSYDSDGKSDTNYYVTFKAEDSKVFTITYHSDKYNEGETVDVYEYKGKYNVDEWDLIDAVSGIDNLRIIDMAYIFAVSFYMYFVFLQKRLGGNMAIIGLFIWMAMTVAFAFNIITKL
jgi:hypothetical protein